MAEGKRPVVLSEELYTNMIVYLNCYRNELLEEAENTKNPCMADYLKDRAGKVDDLLEDIAKQQVWKA